MGYIGQQNMRYAPAAVRAACLASGSGWAGGVQVNPHRGGGYFECSVAKTNGLWVITERMKNAHAENMGLDYPPSALPSLYVTTPALISEIPPVHPTPGLRASEEEWADFREAMRVRGAACAARDRLLRDSADYVFSWQTASRDCWDHLASLIWVPSEEISPLQMMARVGADLRDAR